MKNKIKIISGTVSSPLHGITPRGRFKCNFTLNTGKKKLELKVTGEAYLKSRKLLFEGSPISVSVNLSGGIFLVSPNTRRHIKNIKKEEG